jgi:hypothetical protein
MVAAKVLHSAAEYPRLLAKMQDMATVLACAYNSRITLKRPSRMAGSLARLAIPVSSNFEHWYNREGASNHAFHPVCRIDPRKCTTVYGNVERKAQSAGTAIWAPCCTLFISNVAQIVCWLEGQNDAYMLSCRS